ncbi:M48 family metallopeptidase [Geofilum sp. OHC36d9]|uniref:M48 family metallopeptidase n=1 Tax=Geofilum sp. OHC36d9 TaxID=3458413 RepID=UPI0040341428
MMQHTALFYVILAIILLDSVWGFFLDALNSKNWAQEVPDRLKDVFSEEQFKKQKAYRKVNYQFGILSSLFSLLVLLALLWFNGFAFIHEWLKGYTESWLWLPLLFFGLIGLGTTIVSLPFSVYETFVIEQKFDFNKTTPVLFFSDILKSLLLGGIIGGLLLGLFIWFYGWAGTRFWLYAWAVTALFMLFFGKFYSSVILPLFNKLKPLDDGELRKAIETMSRNTGFTLENIFVMDGSKRSTKSNAFFSGFGKNKKIVLFDTLIDELTNDEIVAVLAHEIGHNKLKHTIRGTILGILQSGLTLFLLGWFINYPAVSQALGVDEPTFHIGLLGFGLLYTPVSGVIGLAMTLLSRRQEYQADAFAARYCKAEALQSALKKISASALSNPTPHPWYVFFHYSHPPLLERLSALDKFC